MTDAIQQPIQQPTPEQIAFDTSVDQAIGGTFESNRALIDGGQQPTAVALANALCAVDLSAAIVVETGGDSAKLDLALASLFNDMKVRAATALAFYVGRVKEAQA